MGLAIEAATAHVEVMAVGADGRELALEAEEVDQEHTRRLAPLVACALARAGLEARSLRWVAADLGPGSFTGVRVGLATAEALALAAGAELCGATSLAALAFGAPVRRALVVPLVPAGRRDVYAGFFRADGRGVVTLLAAPWVGPADRLPAEVGEALPLTGSSAVRFVGPGVAREREALERFHPGSTALGWRHEGLSARDLAHAARSQRGPAAGLPRPQGALEPLYVRSAQAEERVRRRASAAEPTTIRPLSRADVAAVAAIEREVFTDPWPESFFHGELAQPGVYATMAERGGRLAGYLVAWLSGPSGHIGNLAVVPGERRRGVARRLLEDLIDRAGSLGVKGLALEVRVSNFAAQALYRAYGFRLAGIRRGYYRDTGEDALIMEWRAQSSPPVARG
jgi:ribosomal-protein-alanine acetyltransferase/tRNA threonylcarbamoyl adenosine modification protein YeaZ